MQSLSVPTARNPNSHTPAEVLSALQAQRGARRWSFRYEHLSSANVLLGGLSTVLSGEVSQSWLSPVKRTAKFTILDDGGINYLQDRVKPYARLHLPPYGDDDWVEWPQGVFILSSPSRSIDESGTVTRTVDAYDPLRDFQDDKTTDRYTVTAGTAYTTAVSTLLGSISKTIATSASTLAADLEWEIGTTKLKVINDLLAAINYESLSFDEDGTAVVKPYTTPSTRPEEYTYADDESSLVFPGTQQALDLFGVANKWVIYVSRPDRTLLTATYTNSDPSSPTSTVSRQRTITDVRTETDAADQTALNAKVARLAFEASQVFESVDFTTAIMPIHSGNDVYRIALSDMAMDAKYAETSWTMPLAAGATMRHSARRVVTV